MAKACAEYAPGTCPCCSARPRRKRVTMARVRNMAKEYGAEFYSGAGYFYFRRIAGPAFREEGVMVNRLSALTLSEWEMELIGKIKEAQ